MSLLSTLSSAARLQQDPTGTFHLQNQSIERVIQAEQGGALKPIRIGNLITGETATLGDEEFALITSAGEISSRDFKITSVNANAQDETATLEIQLETAAWRATIRYELTGEQPFDTRSLTLEYIGAEPTQLIRVWDGSFTLPEAGKIIKTSTANTDLAAFARQTKGGFFFNVDFPYSEIQIEGQRIRLGYVLEDEVTAGYIHAAETINIGAYALTGELVSTGGGTKIDFNRGDGTWGTEMEINASVLNSDSPDRGEIEAFRALYVQLLPDRMQTAFHFQQSYDDMDPRREQASIMDRPESVQRELQLCKDWGFNVYLMYEDHAVFLPERPALSVVDKISRQALGQGLDFGSLSPCNYTEGFFWKSEPKPWPNPEWKYLKQDDTRDTMAACWAAPGLLDYLLQRDIPWIEKYNWTAWGLDFFIVNPCFDKTHHHPLGRDSFYKQMKAAERYHQGLRAASPNPDKFVILTWLGYETWLPKIGKMADYFYMADPANLWPVPAVNMSDQLLAGYRRMFYRLYNEQGITGRLLQNPIFLANWRDGLIPDSRTYQRHFISLFSFSPNVNVQQPWRFLESLTVAEHAEAYAFFAKWFQYAKDNYEALSRLILLSPSPAPGVLEAYAHPTPQGDKSILVIINSNFFSMPLDLKIGSALGLKAFDGHWMIQEKFPRDQWSLIDGKVRWNWDDPLTLQIPPKTTMLIEISHAADVAPGSVRWYGYNPDATGKQTDGTWALADESARSFPVALEAATGTHVAAIQARNPEPRDPFAPLAVRYQDNIAFFDLKFPQYLLPNPVQDQLSDWVVKPGALEEGLQQGWKDGIASEPTRFPLASVLNAKNHDQLMEAPAEIKFEGKNIGKFMGTSIYNVWQWDMPLELKYTLATGAPAASTQATTLTQTLPQPEAKGPVEFADTDAYWLSTTLAPMIVHTRWMGYTPYFDKHLFIPLPFVDYEKIEEIKAWVNGRPAIVETINYPLVPPFREYFTPGTHKFIYYLDGSKNNLESTLYGVKPNTITLWVKWKS